MIGMSPYDYYISPEEYTVAAANGITPKLLNHRVRELGWDKKRAMATPVRKMTDRSHWRKMAEQNGISYKTFTSRIYMGWTEERAATTPLPSPEEVRQNALRASEKARAHPEEYIQLAEQNGIPYATFQQRVTRLKWDYERAATEPVWSRQQMGRLGAQRLREREGNWADLIFKRKG